MNRLLLSLVALVMLTVASLFPTPVNAQGVSELWRISLPTTNTVDRMETDADGNLYKASIEGEFNLSVVKYRSNGEKVWQTPINLTPTGYGPITKLRRITLDSQGNVFLLGTIGARAAVIKVSPAGTLQWIKRYSLQDNGVDLRSMALDMDIDGSGNFYILGVFDSSAPSGDDVFIYVLKCNPTGTKLWHRMVPQDDDFPGQWFLEDNTRWNLAEYNYIKVNAQGDQFVFGPYTGLSKLDRDGDVKWNHFYYLTFLYMHNPDGSDQIIRTELWPANLVLDSAGNVCAAGTYHSGGLTPRAVRTMKYQATTGVLMWEQNYSLPDKSITGIDMRMDRSDNILFYLATEVAWGFPSSSPDVRILKYNSNGSLLWSYKRSAGSGLADNAPAGLGEKPTLFAVDPPGNAYFLLRTPGESDLINPGTLVKVSPNGAELDARNIGSVYLYQTSASFISSSEGVYLLAATLKSSWENPNQVVEKFLVKYGTAGTIADVAFAPDGLTRLLWRGTNNTIRLDRITSTGVVQNRKFLPAPVATGITFTAEAISAGKDNKNYLLWRGSDNRAILQRLSADLSTVEATSTTYGPYLGWIPFDIAVANATASDGKPRLLWRRTTEANRISLWRLTNSLALDTSLESAAPTNTQPIGLALGADNLSHVLWKTTASLSTGKNAYYRLNANSLLLNSVSYGPYGSYIATDVASGNDNKARLLWQNPTASGTNALLMLLSLNGTSIEHTSSLPPPVVGAVPIKTSSMGNLGRTEILWRRPDGKVTVQTIDPTTGKLINIFTAEP